MQSDTRPLPNGTPDYFELDGSGMTATDAFAAWSAVLPYYEVTALAPDDFAVRARAWVVADVIVTDTILSPVRLVRSQALIAADRSDDVAIQFLLSGSFRGEADGRRFSGEPGDVTFLDMSRPYAVTNTDMRLITVRVPQAGLGAGAAGADLHGLALRAGEAPLLTGMLQALPATLTRQHTPRRALADLLCSHVVLALTDAGVRPRTAREEQLSLAVRRYLDAQLAQPLDVAGLCSSLGVSRSAVYRLFTDEGGLAAFVARRRLARIYAALTDPAERRSIREIAAATGIVDQAHLTRVFRRTFGCTPGQVRATPGHRPVSSDAASLRSRLIERD